MDKMQYVNLGTSGLKVSRFSFGNYANTGPGAQEHSDTLIKKAFDLGINFFDTAEGYASGEAERLLGVSLKKLAVPRTDYLVGTKIFFGQHAENVNPANNLGTSRKRIVEGLERSLKRLQLDYVDVVFCHRYDNNTPTIEVCQAMKTVIDQGKALYWATSNWPAARIMEAIFLSDQIGGYRPIAEQCEYHMLRRTEMEAEFVPLFESYKYGTTIWSPLAMGVLTGKYNDGIPEDSRFKQNAEVEKNFLAYLGDGAKEVTIPKLKAIKAVADELGCTQPQLAIAWTIRNRDVSTCILGASSVDQLTQNVAALQFVDKITPEIEDRIEAILNNSPVRLREYLTQAQTFLSRRKLA